MILTHDAVTAKNRIQQYLRDHNIQFQSDFDEGTPRVIMVYKGYPSCPGNALEGCIWFYSTHMESRTYYSESAARMCRESQHRTEAYRLMNFINASVWSRNADGVNGTLYRTNYLYTPRLYITEDNSYDITLTSLIDYDFYNTAPLETADYITASCPELLSYYSIPIFYVLLGEMSVANAMSYVEKEILKIDSASND